MSDNKRPRVEEIIDTTASIVDLTGECSTSTAPVKKIKKSNDIYINNKREFMLTYANTYGILSKDMVEMMLKERHPGFEYIICLEKCHNTDDHEHIHVYLNWTGKNRFKSNDLRVFDVYDDRFTNESKSNHPNIKGKLEFGNRKKGSYNMIRYVLKEDNEVLSNFDYEQRLKDLKGKSKRETPDASIIPFFDWIHENPVPTQEEVRERIRGNIDWYNTYINIFLNINGVIKHEFPIRNPPKVTPKFDYEYTIPLDLYKWIEEFENWVQVRYQRPRGLWITGKSRTGKTSLCASLGPYNYFPNIWDMSNFNEGAWYNFFDDQDIIIDSPEAFRYFKPFIGSQEVMTLTDKYKAKRTVTNGIPCIWCSNLRFEEQVTDASTRAYIKKNMVVVELGEYDLLGNHPPSHTISSLLWKDWYPKASYYYLNYVSNVLTDNQALNDEANGTDSLNVEPPTSPLSNPATLNFLTSNLLTPPASSPSERESDEGSFDQIKK